MRSPVNRANLSGFVRFFLLKPFDRATFNILKLVNLTLRSASLISSF
ncbi:hypothetical protein AVDCRST_MAG81-1909 [uncultured Synechococcales cyanobacterium]|uniref:Uncharacterized protein n=1 Tax=uncultured Synechococcales cyanobacterium TaxID=1936017 RepID=A0A6J4ULN7_9CYAN|nr:hypothetical protein AVDCRST_MAG81-1909 [uncultured Synechococcales cyanobacterium]